MTSNADVYLVQIMPESDTTQVMRSFQSLISISPLSQTPQPSTNGANTKPAVAAVSAEGTTYSAPKSTQHDTVDF